MTSVISTIKSALLPEHHGIGSDLTTTTYPTKQVEARPSIPNINLADFAKASYHPEATPPKGYHVDTELSGPDRTMYVHDTDPTAKKILSFRGTQLDNPSNRTRDILTDISMVAGLQEHTNRFKNSLDVAKRAVDKYGKDNVLVTGHSLGADQGMYVSHKLDLQGEVYSPFLKFGEQYPNSKVKINMIAGDIVPTMGELTTPNLKVYHTPGSTLKNSLVKMSASHPLKSIKQDTHSIDNFTSWQPTSKPTALPPPPPIAVETIPAQTVAPEPKITPSEPTPIPRLMQSFSMNTPHMQPLEGFHKPHSRKHKEHSRRKKHHT